MLIKAQFLPRLNDVALPATPAPRRHRRLAAVGTWLQAICRWVERGRQRAALADLDAHLLKDVGISPDEAAREIAKPFWRR